MKENIVSYLKDVIANPGTYLEKWKRETSRPVVAYVCSYVPEELIWARGAIPFRFFGQRGDTPEADSLVQAYCCKSARGILEGLLKHGSLVDGIMFSNTCDTMQRISDLYRLVPSRSECIEIMSPCRLEGSVPLLYFARVLQSMGEGIPEKDLIDAVSLYNEIRELMRKIHMDRLQGRVRISNEEMHVLHLGGMLLPPKELVSLLRQLVSEEVVEPRSRRGIVITGSMYLNDDFFRFFDERGITLAYVDMCTGMRPYERDVRFTGNIFHDIAMSYYERPLCPAKFAGPYQRIKHLKKLCTTLSPGGLIFLFPKFCDPHCFDYPDIEEALGNRWKVLLLEIEDPWKFSSQEKTRLEAFLESI